MCLQLACSYPTDVELFPASPGNAFTLVRSELPLPAGSAQPLDPLIRLTFSDFPEPGSVKFPSLRLVSRLQTVEQLFQIDLVDQQILVRPRTHLLPENDYFVDVGVDLRSLSGQPLQQATRLPFRTGPIVSLPSPPEPMWTASDIFGPAARLRARCAVGTCHTPSAGLPAARGLDLSGSPDEIRGILTSRRAGDAQPGESGPPVPLLLVEPGRPDRSYLLRKLLAHRGFTRSDGQPMPPPPLPPLDEESLRAVQLWIRQGAPGP